LFQKVFYQKWGAYPPIPRKCRVAPCPSAVRCTSSISSGHTHCNIARVPVAGRSSGLKAISKSHLHSVKYYRALQHEIEVQKRLRQPMATQLLEIFHDDRSVVLAMELAQGRTLVLKACDVGFKRGQSLGVENIFQDQLVNEIVILVGLETFAKSCGSLGYTAPELLSAKESRPRKLGLTTVHSQT